MGHPCSKPRNQRGLKANPEQPNQSVASQSVSDYLLKMDQNNFYKKRAADVPVEVLKSAFAQVAGSGKSLVIDQFTELCHTAKLPFTEAEIARVFEQISGDGILTEEEFILAVKRWKFLSSIVSAYSPNSFAVSETYDFDLPTCQNYDNPNKEQFFGEFQQQRATIDYSYHSNYTEERQMWQDAMIKSVVKRTEAQARPWLILTCGMPGVGKSFALSWMSEHGFFPLESIVRVDPDQFKFVMPEWADYLKKSSESAARLCHRESSFLAELAQLVAMANNQHVWVDTTLKDHQWFAAKFDEFRITAPLYRIAIFHVVAPLEHVMQRLAERAARTGRVVPPEIVAETARELANSLEVLTPKVNFVARISNGAAPKLEAVQVVDSSGSWSSIQHNFAHVQPAANEFPRCLAPFFVMRTVLQAGHLSVHPEPEETHRRNSRRVRGSIRLSTFDASLFTPEVSQVVASLATKDTELQWRPIHLSPADDINLDTQAKRLALIPDEAKSFRYLYPVLDTSNDQALRHVISNPEQMKDTILQLFLYGGFVYFDDSHNVIAINAIVTSAQPNVLQFGPPQPVPKMVRKALQQANRWKPTTLGFIKASAATRFCWILPTETFGLDVPLSRFGGFAYDFSDGKCLLFPVASPSW